MTSLRYGHITPAQRRYQTHTARAARRVAGVFGAHLWGLGDLPTDETGLTTVTTPTGVPSASGGAVAATADDGTALPSQGSPAPVNPDDVVPSYTTGLMAVGMGTVYGGAIGAVSAASLPGIGRGALAAGGLSAFGVALAYATLGQKAPALGFGLGAAGAVGLAIYLAVRARRARG